MMASKGRLLRYQAPLDPAEPEAASLTMKTALPSVCDPRLQYSSVSCVLGEILDRRESVQHV